jgi:hypothetical protein
MDAQSTTFNLCVPFSHIMHSHYTTTPQLVANFNWETGLTHKNHNTLHSSLKDKISFVAAIRHQSIL